MYLILSCFPKSVSVISMEMAGIFCLNGVSKGGEGVGRGPDTKLQPMVFDLEKAGMAYSGFFGCHQDAVCDLECGAGILKM